MDGVGPAPAARGQRARLALVALVALALPAAIIVLGSRQPAPQIVEVASAAVTDAPSTTVEASTSEATEARQLPVARWGAAPTTAAPTTTTAAPTTAAPTTTAAPATTTTTSKPAPTTVRPTIAPAAVQAAPATTAPPVTSPPPSGSTSDLAFLACIRQRESGGNYAIVSRNGLYHGAYQFLQGTWNSAAGIAGRPDLVGRAPETVAPADQDAVALAYYHVAGSAPWGGHCP